jgi:hypothetical protein
LAKLGEGKLACHIRGRRRQQAYAQYRQQLPLLIRFTSREELLGRSLPLRRRKVLFVNPQFTIAIKDMDERESRPLLDTLFR